MKYTSLMPDFANVAATGTAVCDLTAEVGGKVLEALRLALGGTTFTRAHITGWRLKGDGKVLRESNGADTNTIYSYFGGANLATEMVIDFMAPWARTPQALCAGALDLAYQLSKINRVTLEVDIAGATAPTLKAWAELSDSEDIPSERPFRWVMLRENRATFPITVAGESNISSYIPNFMPVEGGSVFRQIHLFGAQIQAVRIRKDGRDWWNGPVATLQAFQKRAKRVPQTNHVCFDPGLEGMMGRVFDTTKYNAGDIANAQAQGKVLPGAGTCQNADFYVTLAAGETLTVQTQELILVSDH